MLPGVVAGTLAARWSPPQMAGWLRQTLPSDHERPVSHDTIYLSLFVQSRGVLRRTLLTPLRRGRRCRHSRHATRAGQRREATTRAAHHAFTIATRVQVYCCDPPRPWQRGSHEHTNGLLRQYFPDGLHRSALTQVPLDRGAKQLNTRPRMTLGYQTPVDKLAQIVASTR